MSFLYQVVYNEFLTSCYVRYSTSIFSCLFMFLELKYKKCCNILSHNYCLFTFDRKCLKIIAFSKRFGLKMNGSSIGLGNKMTQVQYAIIALKMSLLPIWKDCFNVTHERQKARRKVSF